MRVFHARLAAAVWAWGYSGLAPDPHVNAVRPRAPRAYKGCATRGRGKPIARRAEAASRESPAHAVRPRRDEAKLTSIHMRVRSANAVTTKVYSSTTNTVPWNYVFCVKLQRR